MKTSHLTRILLAAVLALAATTQAQPLVKRHQIELRLGMWNQVTDSRTEIGVGGVETSVGANGAMGGFAYGHWLQENLALRLSLAGMLARFDVKTGAAGVNTENAGVTQILMGLRYYFPRSTYGSSVRPYAAAGAGMFIGSQTKSTTGSTVTVESRSATAIGGQAGAGVDFLLSRRFMLGVNLAYDFVADFKEPIGGSENYSGPEFTVGLSYLFGGGVN